MIWLMNGSFLFRRWSDLTLFMISKAHVFKTRSGSCAAFLANYDASSSARVSFGNNQYDLPPWSVSILPDCKTAIFNTAKVRQNTFQILKFHCVDIFFVLEDCSESSTLVN